MPYIKNLRDYPELLGPAASWFHDKWNISRDIYYHSMVEAMHTETAVPAWYLVLDQDRIIAGCGVITQDFHNRPDLTPNLCALYVEDSFRGQGIAGTLLSRVCIDLRSQNLHNLYLMTHHTSFYEQYGWAYLCDALQADHAQPIRIYQKRLF